MTKLVKFEIGTTDKPSKADRDTIYDDVSIKVGVPFCLKAITNSEVWFTHTDLLDTNTLNLTSIKLKLSLKCNNIMIDRMANIYFNKAFTNKNKNDPHDYLINESFPICINLNGSQHPDIAALATSDHVRFVMTIDANLSSWGGDGRVNVSVSAIEHGMFSDVTVDSITPVAFTLDAYWLSDECN